MESRFCLFCFIKLDGSRKGEIISIKILDVVTHFKHIVDDAAIDGLLEEVL